MSDTPRTDRKEYTLEYGSEPVVESKFARELERENAELRKLAEQQLSAQAVEADKWRKEALAKDDARLMLKTSANTIKDMAKQLSAQAELITAKDAENWRLHTQCGIIKDIERHRVHKWYHDKLSVLHAWAKKQPEDVSHPIFSCLANGSPSVYESPEHTRMLPGLELALEKAEKELSAQAELIEQMREALDACSVLLDYVPTRAHDSKDEFMAEVGRIVNVKGVYRQVNDALEACKKGGKL